MMTLDLKHAQAFSLFSVIIDRLQEEVRPFVPGILQLLPAVWSDAEGQSIMRIQVPQLKKASDAFKGSTINAACPCCRDAAAGQHRC